MAILPVICHQVQISTYKLDTASMQSASLMDVDSMIKVCFSSYTLIAGFFTANLSSINVNGRLICGGKLAIRYTFYETGASVKNGPNLQ